MLNTQRSFADCKALLKRLSSGVHSRTSGRRPHLISSDLTPERILIIDDEAPLVRIMAIMLRRRGYVVDTASDGELGLASAVVHLPDLILLDAHLPTIHGVEVCRELRSHLATRETAIVFVTGMGNAAANALAIDAMADGVLTKPFSLADLLDVVRSSLLHHQHNQQHHARRAQPVGA